MQPKNKEQTPLLSICYSCYNVSKYIRSSLDSLLDDFVKNSDKIEILLIDDCSPDNGKTLKIEQEFANKYKNIKLIKNNENIGVSKSRNKAIELARGKYITFPDPDDKYINNAIKKIYDSLKNNDVDILVTGLVERHLDSKDKTSKLLEINHESKILNNNKDIVKESVELEEKVLFGYVWNKFYKLSLIRKNNIKFNKNYTYIEDISFNIDFCKVCNSMAICNFPSIMYYRRLTKKESITAQYNTNYFNEHYKRVESFLNWWDSTSVLDDHSMNVLRQKYIRYSMSAVWRNYTKDSHMSTNEQITWIEDYYKLPLTKLLFKKQESTGLINKIFENYVIKQNTKGLIRIAKLIDFVTKHLSGLLITLR